MKDEEQDKLKGLFHKINIDKPSTGFEDRLMQQVFIVAKKQKQRNYLISIISIVCGIAVAVGIPVLIFRLFGITLDLSNLSVEYTIPHIKFDPMILSIAIIVFLLLVGDLLIRKHIWDKRHKD